MTKTKKILALLLALLLATGTLLGLASCDFGGDKDNESDPAESTVDSESETEGTTAAKPLELVKDGKTDFVIIVPTDSDLFTQDMVDAVNSGVAHVEVAGS